MNEFLLYLVLILDNTHGMLTGFTVALVFCIMVGVAVSLITGGCYYVDRHEGMYTPFKVSLNISMWLIVSVILLSLANTLLPTTQQAAVIYVVPKLLRSDTSETLSRLPNKIALKLEKYVDEWATDVAKSDKEAQK